MPRAEPGAPWQGWRHLRLLLIYVDRSPLQQEASGKTTFVKLHREVVW
jgi:hypothetical protein